MKKKEPPFCYPYSMKARVLVLAHLARMDVSEELEEGRTCKFIQSWNYTWHFFFFFLQNTAKGASAVFYMFTRHTGSELVRFMSALSKAVQVVEPVL